MIPLWDRFEKKLASEKYQQRVRELEEKARASIGRESGELVLHYHAFAVAEEAGQRFVPQSGDVPGIDASIALTPPPASRRWSEDLTPGTNTEQTF